MVDRVRVGTLRYEEEGNNPDDTIYLDSIVFVVLVLFPFHFTSFFQVLSTESVTRYHTDVLKGYFVSFYTRRPHSKWVLNR